MRFSAPGDPLAAFAARPRALWLEVGFGGGEHAAALARTHPDVGLIACEVFEQGLCSLLASLVAEGAEADAPLPGNLRIWDDDARDLLRALPEACLDRLYLMFPDPWPKARHAKRRFVHPDIVSLAASRMRPGAEWRAASDDPTYQAWVSDVMGAQEVFHVAAPETQRPDGWPATRYEAKARTAGRTPIYWVFTRL
jgi:tRNA (guanine-N7-)-methyltransferase